MRSILSPAFTGSKMRAMFTLISECSEQFADYFVEQSNQSEPIEVEMRDILTKLANDVIASCAFGFKSDTMRDKENEFYKMAFDATNFNAGKAHKFFLYSISPSLAKFFKVKFFDERTCNFFRSLVKDTITIREKENIVRPDMIHLLMEAKKGKLKHGDKKDEAAGFATVEESDVGKQNTEKYTQGITKIISKVIFFINLIILEC